METILILFSIFIIPLSIICTAVYGFWKVVNHFENKVK